MKLNKLSRDEKEVIINKNTEKAFSGKYIDHFNDGVYICKQCEAPLYLSQNKFKSDCGWPSFDDEIKNAVTKIPDQDDFRTEIICNNCQAHLGHVFKGEHITQKNIRHCVNSISLKFKKMS